MLRGALPAAKFLFLLFIASKPLCTYSNKRKTVFKRLVRAYILLFFAVNILYYEAQGTFSSDAAPSHF